MTVFILDGNKLRPTYPLCQAVIDPSKGERCLGQTVPSTVAYNGAKDCPIMVNRLGAANLSDTEPCGANIKFHCPKCDRYACEECTVGNWINR